MLQCSRVSINSSLFLYFTTLLLITKKLLSKNFCLKMFYHAVVHFCTDLLLGRFLSSNKFTSVLVESSFLTFVGICIDPEDFLYCKFIIACMFLLLVIMYDFEYKQVFDDNARFCHDFGHEAFHFLLSFVIELYFGWENFLINPKFYSYIFLYTAILYSFIHILWEVNQCYFIKVCFVSLLMLHLFYFVCYDDAFLVVIPETSTIYILS